MPSLLLDGYLRRIGLAAPAGRDIDTLRRLHIAHVDAIPFENLDILLGRGIRLDLDHLQNKLIAQRRGGYCFEHNTLFLAILRDLGFTVSAMEARVRAGSTDVRPRTHMILSVEIDGEPWLADVGFGGEGLREPVPMDREHAVPASGTAYRVVRERDVRVMQMRRAGAWIDQYAFLPHAVQPVDFEVANWFTSTYPQSPFVRTLTAQRSTRDVRYILKYPAYTEIRESGTSGRVIARDELMPLLRDVFGIVMPLDTLFPAIDDPICSSVGATVPVSVINRGAPPTVEVVVKQEESRDGGTRSVSPPTSA
jgi:N-hydroxyarylamine O-acetyltransferase